MVGEGKKKTSEEPSTSSSGSTAAATKTVSVRSIEDKSLPPATPGCSNVTSKIKAINEQGDCNEFEGMLLIASRPIRNKKPHHQ